MVQCEVCGEMLPEETRACSLCGTSVKERTPTGTVVMPPAGEKTELVAPPPSLPAGSRYCPGCMKIYGPEYEDMFCVCGVELSQPTATATVENLVELPPAVRPPTGTPCLLLLGDDKEPVQYFPLTKDATLVGRLDPMAGVFPDIDLDAWLDRSAARKISRKHILILRNRATGNYRLRPLAGNTGTQLETDMIVQMHDYPLQPGHRLILGGTVRFKFIIS